LNPRLGAEFLIQLAHGGFVIAGVAEENAERTGHERMKGMMNLGKVFQVG